MPDSNPTLRNVVWAGTVACAALATLIAFLLWPLSIDAVASKTLHAARTGNGAVLYRYTFEDQIEAAEFTEDKLAKIWQVSVLPRMKKYREISPPSVEVNADHSQAVARVEMKDSEGHVLELTAAPFASDTGPRISPMDFVTAMWTQEYVVERGKPVTTLSILQARLEGLSHDRAALESVGLKGFPSRQGDGSFYMWDDAIVAWQKTIDEIIARRE